jgi:AraC-like DNA-binding protein
MSYVLPLLLGVKNKFNIELSDLNIPKNLLAEPLALVPYSVVAKWLVTLGKLTKDDAYLIDIASELSLQHLQESNNWFLSSPDMGITFRRINYGINCFQSGASYYASQSGKIIKWCYNNPYTDTQDRVLDSLRIAIMFTQTIRHFKGPNYSPIQVHLSGTDISHKKIAEFFGCTVVFNAPQTQIWLSMTDLMAVSQVNSVNAVTTMSFDAYLNMPQPHDSPKVLYETVNFSRYYGLPTVDNVAAYFGYSRQQFQRRLQKVGFNFTTIMSYVLSNQAVKYMENGKSIDEITQLLGYSSKQSFNKAFQKVRGVSAFKYLELYL